MADFYKCEYFKIYELVDRQTYLKYGEEAWMFFNPLALMSLDGIRKFFNIPVKVNDWKWGGDFQFRGLRPVYYQYGAIYSQHRYGNGFDSDVGDISAEEVRRRIIENKDSELLRHITCIESNVNWLHFDCRNISDRIRIVGP